MKNKTLATWLALLGGPFGLHRFYLYGWRDVAGWLLPIPTLAGITGMLRLRNLGVDDRWGWLLSPLFGFVLAGCALNAIVYGLMAAERWNQRFNAPQPSSSPAGDTHWLTVLGVGTALFIGAAALMAALALSFERYFAPAL